MSRYQWVFRRECGCAFGVMEDGGHTQGEAWKDFFDQGAPAATTKAIGLAVAAGVTTVKTTHARYVAEFQPQLRSEWKCPHSIAEAWCRLPAGNVVHAVKPGSEKAVCGIGPRMAGDAWSGASRVEASPKCGRCTAKIAKIVRGAS